MGTSFDGLCEFSALFGLNWSATVDRTDVWRWSSNCEANMATYSASHILVKHQGSRRKASWKDPEGAVIGNRSRDEAVTILEGYLSQLGGLAGDALAARFAQLAGTESDCGSAKDGGDLGVFGPGQMMAPFEEATAALGVGEISGLVDTDSGTHIILRTGPKGYRASHILVKHEGSRRKASWKDPEGATIKTRTRDQAATMLESYRATLSAAGDPQTLLNQFAQMASTESDCGSAQDGGDLGFFESGQMMAPFEEATAAIAVGQMSGLVDTDSGTHIILRTG
jgi:NIMA-interacting peptidyl-prolyl cis-trans isomerase 1